MKIIEKGTTTGALLVALLLCPLVANAGCDDIAHLETRNLYIDISDGDCIHELNISFSRKINSDGTPDTESIKSFPFAEECTASRDFDELSCRANGHTPLAGATYKLKQIGTYTLDCRDMAAGIVTLPHEQYVCVSGCDKQSVPRKLKKRHAGCD